MNNIFIIASIISIIFFIAKLIEMRFVEKETKPLKIFIKDSLIVYLSIIFGDFIFQQFNILKRDLDNITPVFTDNPSF
jgi:hypothetical protein